MEDYIRKELENRKSWEDHFQAAAREAAKADLQSWEWGCPRPLQQDLRWAADNWALAGFNSKNEADRHYRELLVAEAIRSYFRRHRITTRKGSQHAFDCRREHLRLWAIVRGGDMDAGSNGVRWSYRTVDGLKNLYVFFEERE